MGTDSTSAMTSMPRPVPAAHLSFMMKFSTLPRSSHADDLAVLAAHVEDGADAGAAHEVGAPGVAGDLGDGPIGEGDVDPAVAGADRVGDVVKRQPDGLAGAPEGAQGAVGAG